MYLSAGWTWRVWDLSMVEAAETGRPGYDPRLLSQAAMHRIATTDLHEEALQRKQQRAAPEATRL